MQGNWDLTFRNCFEGFALICLSGASAHHGDALSCYACMSRGARISLGAFANIRATQFAPAKAVLCASETCLRRVSYRYRRTVGMCTQKRLYKIGSLNVICSYDDDLPVLEISNCALNSPKHFGIHLSNE